jgi:hypothetical protein
LLTIVDATAAMLDIEGDINPGDGMGASALGLKEGRDGMNSG